MKKVFTFFCAICFFTIAGCNTRSTETTETSETTTESAPAIMVDPDEAILKTDTTLEHDYPSTLPAGTGAPGDSGKGGGK